MTWMCCECVCVCVCNVGWAIHGVQASTDSPICIALKFHFVSCTCRIRHQPGITSFAECKVCLSERLLVVYIYALAIHTQYDPHSWAWNHIAGKHHVKAAERYVLWLNVECVRCVYVELGHSDSIRLEMLKLLTLGCYSLLFLFLYYHAWRLSLAEYRRRLK